MKMFSLQQFASAITQIRAHGKVTVSDHELASMVAAQMDYMGMPATIDGLTVTLNKVCHDCGEEIIEENLSMHINGHTVCVGCIENDYKACETCGELYHIDSDELVDDDWGYICVECIANSDDRPHYHWYEEAI